MKKSEGQILREIELALSALRRPDGSPVCIVWRQHVGKFMGQSGYVTKVGIEGQADLGGVLFTGRAIQIEVKSETGRLSEAQERWGAAMRRMNALWMVARSADEAVAAVRAEIQRAA
jgi:hypothetical protein